MTPQSRKKEKEKKEEKKVKHHAWIFVYRDTGLPVWFMNSMSIFTTKWKAIVRKKEHVLNEKIKVKRIDFNL